MCRLGHVTPKLNKVQIGLCTVNERKAEFTHRDYLL